MGEKDIGKGQYIVKGTYSKNNEDPTGLDGGRTVDMISGVWAETGLDLPMVDNLISVQIEKLARQGIKKFHLLDVGSGNGQLLRSLVCGQDLPLVGQMLSLFPQMEILAEGITAADSNEDHLTNEEITSENDVPGYPRDRVKAVNHLLMLTTKQRITEVITEPVDVVMATVSLCYMGPEAFKQTVNDCIDILKPGGEMVAVGYLAQMPGILTLWGYSKVDVRPGENSPEWIQHLKNIDEGDYTADREMTPGKMLSWIREIEKKTEPFARI